MIRRTTTSIVRLQHNLLLRCSPCTAVRTSEPASLALAAAGGRRALAAGGGGMASPPAAAAAAAAGSGAGPTAEDGDGGKPAVRQSVTRLLRALPADAMAAQSAAIAGHVLASRAFASARAVGVYVTCARLREADTSAVVAAALAAGKRVYVPVVDDRSSNMSLLHIERAGDLAPAPPFGILEPPRAYADGAPREDALSGAAPLLDLLLMPGLAFDATGARLGRGGGYYDKTVRLLTERAAAEGRPRPLLVALAFEEQVLPRGRVPMAPHDALVDALATPVGLVLCTNAARAAF